MSTRPGPDVAAIEAEQRRILKLRDEAEPEESFRQWVVDRAKEAGWLTYHTHRSTRSPSGFPDQVLVRPPRLIFAELKKERGRVSRAQEVWIRWLSWVPGVEVFVWRPSDRESIREILK